MTRSLMPRLLQVLLLGLLALGYPLLMHLLLTHGHWPQATLALALAPFALAPLSLWRAGWRASALAAAAALALAAGWAWGALLQQPALLYLLQNVGMQALLAAMFGHTLLPGREPLIAQLARRIHREDYSEPIARYARQATAAWALYFVAMGLASALIFAFAPLAAWSWFVNFWSFLTLGAMAVGEYAVRRWRLRGIRHVSLWQGLRLYWHNGQASQRIG
jgi:uncharacterized membrane protein